MAWQGCAGRRPRAALSALSGCGCAAFRAQRWRAGGRCFFSLSAWRRGLARGYSIRRLRAGLLVVS
eukprot:1458147-Prymnesium_polylepis.1